MNTKYLWALYRTYKNRLQIQFGRNADNIKHSNHRHASSPHPLYVLSLKHTCWFYCVLPVCGTNTETHHGSCSCMCITISACVGTLCTNASHHLFHNSVYQHMMRLLNVTEWNQHNNWLNVLVHAKHLRKTLAEIRS